MVILRTYSDSWWWSGVACLHGWNSSGIFLFIFRAASGLKWSEFKGQSSRLGLVLLGLTTYCNSVFPDEMSCMELRLKYLPAPFNVPILYSTVSVFRHMHFEFYFLA